MKPVLLGSYFQNQSFFKNSKNFSVKNRKFG
jgi:hypothetical protein